MCPREFYFRRREATGPSGRGSQWPLVFPLWGCGFENASRVAARLPCPPPPQERTSRSALGNGKELKVPLLPMAALPLIRRLQRVGKGREPQQQVLSNFVSHSKFPMNSEKRRKSSIPTSPRSVTGRLEQLQVGFPAGEFPTHLLTC